MTTGIGNINLRVVIVDSDYYALQAINGYLAWDRRTRVTFLTTSLAALWEYLRETPIAELPDVVIIDADHLGSLNNVRDALNRIRQFVPEVMTICLAQTPDAGLLTAVAQSGVRAFLLKQDVRMQIAWAIVYALEVDFLISPSMASVVGQTSNTRVFNAQILPAQQDYPEMTDRIRQAILLCVIEGMPAHLAADEMGISLHTIRGYIKEGYRILESYDQQEYPTDMTPQERAFMRFTALKFSDED